MDASTSARLREYGRSGTTQAVYRTHLLTDVKALEALQPAWELLHSVSSGSNPFSQWEWMRDWWEFFGESSGIVSHQLHVIVMRDETAVRAIFPFVLTTTGKGPMQVRKLHIYGFTGSFTEMRAPLIWPGHEAPAIKALISL